MNKLVKIIAFIIIIFGLVLGVIAFYNIIKVKYFEKYKYKSAKSKRNYLKSLNLESYLNYDNNSTEDIFKQNSKSSNLLLNSLGFDNIYIINLKDRRDRLTAMLNQFDNIGLYSEQLEAIQTNQLNEYENYFTKDNILGIGEKGCFLSHFLAWEKCKYSNKPCIILEDDLVIPLNFIEVLKNIMTDFENCRDNASSEDNAIIRLGRSNSHEKPIKTNSSFKLEKNCKYLGYSSFTTGAWAYIIYPHAAEKLYDFYKNHKIKKATDNSINITSDNDDTMDKRLPQNLYKFYDLTYNDKLDFNGLKLPYDTYRTEVIKELSTWLKDSTSQDPPI